MKSALVPAPSHSWSGHRYQKGERGYWGHRRRLCISLHAHTKILRIMAVPIYPSQDLPVYFEVVPIEGERHLSLGGRARLFPTVRDLPLHVIQGYRAENIVLACRRRDDIHPAVGDVVEVEWLDVDEEADGVLEVADMSWRKLDPTREDTTLFQRMKRDKRENGEIDNSKWLMSSLAKERNLPTMKDADEPGWRQYVHRALRKQLLQLDRCRNVANSSDPHFASYLTELYKFVASLEVPKYPYNCTVDASPEVKLEVAIFRCMCCFTRRVISLVHAKLWKALQYHGASIFNRVL
eukprot:Sspe_Gene.14822::Locus_5139_Transcript_1_1_Confidence_1.000_Length_1072::g.14822::m.14822